MNETILDLIESLLISGQKIYFAYELPDGRVSSVTNGDALFTGKVKSNLISSGRAINKHDDYKSEARRARDEGIAGNKGNVGNKGDTVPGYAHEENKDLEIEKKFTIN